MAKPNYAFAKRQKELAKRQKQEEKRRRKTGTQDKEPQETPAQPPDHDKTAA